MSDKPAVVQGCYVDLRFMPGLKCARISVDIPIEHANGFLQMFGAPDRASPCSVAIARLAPAEQPSSGLSRVTKASLAESADAGDLKSSEGSTLVAGSSPAAGTTPRTRKRSEIAALKLKDPEFVDWLEETAASSTDIERAHYGGSYEVGSGDKTWRGSEEDYGDDLLKDYLGITSKRELDLDGPKAVAFDRMLESFKYRDQVRP